MTLPSLVSYHHAVQ